LVSKDRPEVWARELRARKDGRWEACRGGLVPHTSSPASGRELLWWLHDAPEVLYGRVVN